MAKLKVVGDENAPNKNSVEINGKKYFAGDLVDESEFKPRPADAPEDELSEMDSLLESGHVVVTDEE